MSTSDPVPRELLPWDTEFFGCRIARVYGDTLDLEQAVQIDEWSRSNHVRGLYFLARVDDPTTTGTKGHCRLNFEQNMRFDYHFCTVGLTARDRNSTLDDSAHRREL